MKIKLKIPNISSEQEFELKATKQSGSSVNIALPVISGRSYELVPVKKYDFNPMDYGAVGDGVTDDYDALSKMIDDVNNAGGGTIFFPKGKYFLNRIANVISKHRITFNKEEILAYIDTLTEANNLTFRDVNINIVSEGAEIVTKSDFIRMPFFELARTKDDEENFSYLSEIKALTALSFVNCTGSISGLNTNGNVQNIVRPVGVVERDGHGFVFKGCTDFLIENCDAKNHMGDGFNIGVSAIHSENITMRNCKSLNNARMGLTLGGLINGLFENCDFSETGKTGDYRRHAPSAGVDLEPISTNLNKDILFKNCNFVDNLGSAAVINRSYSGVPSENIIFDGCLLKADESRRPYGVINNSTGTKFINCIFDLPNSDFFPLYGSTRPCECELVDCEIRSGAKGVRAIDYKNIMKFKANNLKLVWTGERVVDDWFPFIRMAGAEIDGLDIQIPEKYFKEKRFIGLIQNGKFKNVTLNGSIKLAKEKFAGI